MHLPTFGRWAENAGNRLTFGRWNWYGGRENAAARGSGGGDASTHLRKVSGKCGKSPHLRKVGEPTTGVCAWMCYRNGTESRNLLPLWKEDGEAIPFREFLAMVLRERRNRNGTESRDLLPLWGEGGGGRRGRRGQCRRSDYRPPAFSSRRSSGWRSEERLSSTDTTIAQTARPMKKYSATTGEEARSMMWPTTIGTVNSPMFCTQ